MPLPKGYKCPKCGEYSDKKTKVIEIGNGWYKFIYGCGHQEKSRMKTIGVYTR